ncbi:hypothetical protein YO5_18052, partial [Stutzerimonas stutzeri TS44]
MKMNAGTLQDYLVATIENAQDHAAEPPQLMFLVDQMDEIFQQEIFAQEYEANAFAALLAMNAYTLLLSAVRQALSGHVVSVFSIARSALESACYGFLIARDEARGDIWLNRHESKESLKMSRKTFTVANAVKEMGNVCAEMAEYIEAHYDAAIDFGAHPNPRSVIHHLEDSGPVGSDHGFSLTGVYGRNSWQVNRELLVCVEVGQAVAFLIAASAADHPLLNDRLSVFTKWMDAKNRMVDEINGEPMDYSG